MLVQRIYLRFTETLTLISFRHKIKLASKLAVEYKDVQVLPPILQNQQAGPTGPKRSTGATAGAGGANAGGGGGGAGPGVKLIGGVEHASCV